MNAAPPLLGSVRWTAIYRCKQHPTQEVVCNSIDRPLKKRVFRVPGEGRRSFKLVSATELNEPKEGFRMARTKSKGTKSKSSRKRKQEEAKEDELEGLEELDEDLEDLEEEEPDEEDTDEEEETTTKKRKRSRSKKSKSKKGKSKRKGTPPPTRELPKGKHGAQEIADIAGVDARTVRLFLRKKENKKRFPKDKESGRYAFNKKDAQAVARAIKAADKE